MPEAIDVVAQRLFVAAAALTAERLHGVQPPRGYIGERSHLPCTYRTALDELALAQDPVPLVSPSLRVALPEHFTKLGPFDVSLAWPAGTAYGELKAGAGSDDIAHCAWDALKCAVAVEKGYAAAAFLVAAAPAALWTGTTLGCELFEDGRWETARVRTRYESWFEWYERNDQQRPLAVVAAFRTIALARLYFTVGVGRWIVGVARVEPDGAERCGWPPFHPGQG